MFHDTNLLDIYCEIIVFGPKNTLDSLQRIKHAPYRLRMVRLFEEAYDIFRDNNKRYSKCTYPVTKKYKESNGH